MKNHHKKRLTRAQKIEAASKQGLRPRQGEKMPQLLVEADFAQLEERALANPEIASMIRQARDSSKKESHHADMAD